MDGNEIVPPATPMAAHVDETKKASFWISQIFILRDNGMEA